MWQVATIHLLVVVAESIWQIIRVLSLSLSELQSFTWLSVFHGDETWSPAVQTTVDDNYAWSICPIFLTLYRFPFEMTGDCFIYLSSCNRRSFFFWNLSDNFFHTVTGSPRRYSNETGSQSSIPSTHINWTYSGEISVQFTIPHSPSFICIGLSRLGSFTIQ